MTDRTTLLALAERCEQAAGPDRELDARIYILITGGSADDADYAATDPDVTCNPPPYTASLDAAVTLVPEGCGWMVMSSAAKVGVWPSHGATPALALCAAALRARASMAQPSSDT